MKTMVHHHQSKWMMVDASENVLQTATTKHMVRDKPSVKGEGIAHRDSGHVLGTVHKCCWLNSWKRYLLKFQYEV